LNANMTPAVPLTAVGGANEDPTAPGSPVPSVGTLHVTVTGALTATIAHMDATRFPAGVGCQASFNMNGTVGSLPIVAGVGGTEVGAGTTAAGVGLNHVTLDISCAFNIQQHGVSLSGTHQTHWVGTV
jgi:hypothetical protein